MSYREPSDLIREKTEPKPNIHEERQARAAELEVEQRERFQREVREEMAEEQAEE